MRNRKATGNNDDVPGDVLNLLREGGLKILVKLINTIYENGEWPKDFTEVTMIALERKKTQATKCGDHRKISLIAHTAKIIAKILRRRLERKIEDVLGEDQFGFRREKGTRDGNGMMRIKAERTLEIDDEVCTCFIDWQKAFDRVNWTKLMEIIRRTGIDWPERRLIRNCTWIRRLNYDWTEGRQEVCRMENELDKYVVYHQFCSNCTTNALTRTLWMGLETSTSEGKLFKL